MRLPSTLTDALDVVGDKGVSEDVVRLRIASRPDKRVP